MMLQLPLTAVLLVAAGVTASTDADVTYRDADGDLVTISLDGPGRLDVRLDGDVATNADATRVAVAGANGDTTLRVSIERGATRIGVVETNHAIGRIVFAGAVHGPMRVRACRVGELRFENGVSGVTVSVLESIDRVVIAGTLDASSIAAATLTHLAVAGDVRDSHVLAGARLDGSGDLTRGQYHAATIVSVRVGGDVVDSIIAAGGDPGVDGRFEDGDILSGGLIESLEVGGVIAGRQSPHVNPGIYAARIGWLHVNGIAGAGKGPTPGMTTGSAVIDPQPSAEAALKKSRVKRILERASKRAVQLGVNATIAITDREGNLLGVVRMDEPPLAAAKTTVKIRAGGKNGLEAVDNFIPTSIIAATKAGTAAFLSTSKGNAFTTRTAGYIIQEHFPPGILFQDGGPLFGVQLSSLPTSDVNRLPLGLSADPGGLPLYRMGELVGGIGVEADGVYTVDPTLVGGASTVEEEIALAGQIGLEPPAEIRADTIFVDGIRLDYANARPPKLSSLNSLRPYANLVASGRLVELLPPRTSPTGVSGRTTMFA
ncbi:MAG: hypothetical protein HKO59_02640, partial [Phycisphaerales bacterium]|nr:hypothetical protein [Phycisphaerales bacterium]